MAAQGTGQDGLAARYAAALFDLADSRKELDAVASDLTSLRAMLRDSGDLQRLIKALQQQWGLGELDCDLRVIQKLQPALRKAGWTATVAIHLGRQITAVWPGFHEKAYGLAIDVGSTTIAAHLCDLASGEVVA